MADDLRIAERPVLRRPVLISAFRGWNDGGQAATVAAAYLARQWDATRFADIDPESFMDFQAVRPTVTLDGGLTRRIEWPENVFFHATVPGTDRDAVILLGVEPNYRWRAFTDLVVGLARDLGVELVVTLGDAKVVRHRQSLTAALCPAGYAPLETGPLEPTLLELRPRRRGGGRRHERRGWPPQRIGDPDRERPDRRGEGHVDEHETPRQGVPVLHLADRHLRDQDAEEAAREPQHPPGLPPRAKKLPADQ